MERTQQGPRLCIQHSGLELLQESMKYVVKTVVSKHEHMEHMLRKDAGESIADQAITAIF